MTHTAKSYEIFFHIDCRDDLAAGCDGPADLRNFRIVGIASYRAGVLAGKVADRSPV